MGSDELSEGEQSSFSSNLHLTRVLAGSNLSIITYEGIIETKQQKILKLSNFPSKKNK